MYRDSVNLSIAHYSRRNSIADAYMKPVFVITRARIDLFPDETYFTLFICALSPLFFHLSSSLFAGHVNCIIASIFHHFHELSAEVRRPFLHHIYLIWIYSYHSHVAFVAKKYHELSLTYFRRNADHTLPERNINEMLFENVRQLLFIVVFIRSLL